MTIRAEISNTFEDKGALLASAAVIFEGELPSGKPGRFIVKNLRVIDGKNGIFVAMPNFKGRNGEYIDNCFPLDNDTRMEIHGLVLAAYDAAKENGE